MPWRSWSMHHWMPGILRICTEAHARPTWYFLGSTSPGWLAAIISESLPSSMECEAGGCLGNRGRERSGILRWWTPA